MDIRSRSIKWNFIFNCILTASNIIFPIISFPYVSRILGPDGTGKVSFATSVVFYFNTFAQLGIPTYGIRSCAKVRDNKYELSHVVKEILVINIVVTIVAYLALFVLMMTVKRFGNYRELLLIISLTIGLNTIGVEWLYKALEQYSYITKRSIIFKFIALIAMFLLVHQKNDYIIYGAVSILASSASNIFNFIKLKEIITLNGIKLIDIKRHLKPILIFFSMSIATTIYTNIDTVMLGFMKTDAEVGYYNAAVKIRTLLLSFVTSLGTVILPRASYYIECNNWNKFNNLSKKAFNFVFILSMSIVLYMIVFADRGILFLSGLQYTSSIIPMQIIMPTIFCVGITNLLGLQILVPIGKEKVVLVSEIIGAIIDLIINAMLIPRYASTGAAIGTLCAEVGVLVVQVVYLRGVVYQMIKSTEIMKILLALLGALAVIVGLHTINFSSDFIALLISGSTYYVILGGGLLLMHEKLTMELLEQLKKSGFFRKLSRWKLWK